MDRKKALSLQEEIDCLNQELEEQNLLWEEKMSLL